MVGNWSLTGQGKEGNLPPACGNFRPDPLGEMVEKRLLKNVRM